MVRRFFSGYVLATLWLHIWTAAGALYPIKPVASTIYEAGFPAEVRWIEDGKTPLLNATGILRIDLYAGKNTYLATIARGVDALSLSTTVFIPNNIPTNHPTYTLHFIFARSSQTIYTANFSIIPNAFSRLIQTPFSLTSLSSSSVSAQPTTTSISTFSRIAGTSTSPSSATKTSSASVGISWRWALRRPSNPKGKFTMNLEKMRFRLMFIVWPALVGFSMSL